MGDHRPSDHELQTLIVEGYASEDLLRVRSS